MFFVERRRWPQMLGVQCFEQKRIDGRANPVIFQLGDSMVNGFLKRPPIPSRPDERFFLRIDPSCGDGGKHDRGDENGMGPAHEVYFSSIMVRGTGGVNYSGKHYADLERGR